MSTYEIQHVQHIQAYNRIILYIHEKCLGILTYDTMTRGEANFG